jgi:iron complex outermembrane receptor protein
VSFLSRAYEIRSHPNIAFNIGRAYEEAGQLGRAVRAYRRYLRAKPADAEAVRARIRRLEAERAAARAKRAQAEREERDREAAEAREGRRRGRGRDARRPPSPAPPPPPTLSDEQLARLADAVVARLEASEALRAPARPPSPSPSPSPSAPPAATRTATAAPPPSAGAVELEAKGGEQYEDVVVTASRRAQSPLEAPNAVTILTEEDIRLSGARTLPDLLRRVPGMDVMAMSYSDYNVAVRGFNRRIANKVLVLIDNRTVYVDFLGGTSWRTLPIELQDIERIEVVRGPGSAVYGAYAYTGIINIITKRPEDLQGAVAQAAGGNGEVVEGSFQYGERLGRLGIRFSGGYQRGEKYEIDFDASRPDVSTRLEAPERSLELARANALLEYHLPTEAPSYIYLGGGIVDAEQELFGVANLRNLHVSGPEGHLRAGFESERLTIRSFWSRVDKNTRSQSFPTGLTDLPTRVVNDVFSFEPIFRPKLELGGTHRLVLGAEYRFKAIEWSWIDGPRTENHFAAYFQDEWTIDPAFRVVASGRLDLHPLIGPLGSPRVAFILSPADGQALRLSVGTAFRVPTMAETYLDLSSPVPTSPGTAVTLVGGGEDLDPEGIATVDLGYRIETDFGNAEAVGYLNRVTNLIVRSPLEPTGAGARTLEDIDAIEVARSLYVNERRAFLAVGAELAARLFPVDGLDVGGSYAFQYIFDEDTGARFTDSPMHKATLWTQLRTALGLDLGISAHFVSDQLWVEPDFDPTSPTGFDADPLPLDASFTLLARVGYRLFEDRLEVAVSGFNLLDVGSSRHREHPFANRLEARVLGSVTGRF